MPKLKQPRPSTSIREHKRLCGVFNTTFLRLNAKEIDPGVDLSQRQVDAVAKAIEKHFNLWWNSWIEPQLKQAERRGQ